MYRPPSPASALWELRCAVFISGGAVLVIEILGSRLLAPVFGTTLHVWTALITVTLAALATGYAAGGRLAERAQGIGPVMLVMTAGAGTLLVADAALSRFVTIAYDAGLVGGPLIAATMLFAPPLVSLGMVTPMAVGAAADPGHIGRSVGNLYALSTLGSVAGSLAVAFVLVPHTSVHAAMLGTAAALMVLPLYHLMRRRGRGVTSIALLGAVSAMTVSGILSAHADRTVLYKGRRLPVTARIPSAYGDLVVADVGDTRYLFLNGVMQGAQRNELSGALYAYGLARLATLDGVPRTMLIWGLGAGIFARAMAEVGVEVTVIEIDPASERVARQYFGLPTSVRVIIGDARIESRRLSERYDVVVLDAFSGDSPPSHLLTREALVEAGMRREPEGLLLINFVGASEGPAARATAAIVTTLAAALGPVQVFAPNRVLRREGPSFVSTMFAVAGNLPEHPMHMPIPVPPDVQPYVDAVAASRVEVANAEAPVLTDARSPLDAWAAPAVRAMRY